MYIYSKNTDLLSGEKNINNALTLHRIALTDVGIHVFLWRRMLLIDTVGDTHHVIQHHSDIETKQIHTIHITRGARPVLGRVTKFHYSSRVE